VKPETRPPRTSTASLVVERLFAPVDIASTALFRIAFGALMLWHVLQYLVGGRLQRAYVTPIVLFKYPGFEWVERASPAVLTVIFAAMAVAALCIAVGLAYRVACAVFFLGHTYMLFLDAAQYQNHLYLICLVALLLIAIPAHRAVSLDALIRGRSSDTIPAWCLWLLRFQLAIPYVYGGLAKLNTDWLVRAQPMRVWLSEGTDRGLRVSAVPEAWAAYGLSWGGALFDLLVIPALLWRRTRIPAVVVTIAFHLANTELFIIGVFPWLMIAALGLYLEPGWPRRVWLVADVFGTRAAARPRPSKVAPSGRGLVLACLAAWTVVQLLLPFRHVLYPGRVDWTEQGHRFSWRMKLRDKRGDLQFVAVDPVGRKAFPLSDLDLVLTRPQQRMMLHDPELMRQTAHYLGERLRRAGHAQMEVRALTSISLNGRKRQPLVDPRVDLSRVSSGRHTGHWITPLQE
jgi:hypothetical protein